jgi:hypothetical protein
VATGLFLECEGTIDLLTKSAKKLADRKGTDHLLSGEHIALTGASVGALETIGVKQTFGLISGSVNSLAKLLRQVDWRSP